MSWLKEVFDFSNENKDPFTKLLLRSTFLVVFIVLVFFAYNIITGNPVEIAGFNFAIRHKDSTINVVKPPVENKDSILRADLVKQADSAILKLPSTDSVKVDTLQNKISILNDTIAKVLPNLMDLTDDDKKQIIKTVYQTIGESNTTNKTPPHYIYVLMYYDNVNHNSEFETQLLAYLKSKGFFIRAELDSPDKFPIGITVKKENDETILYYGMKKGVIINVGKIEWQRTYNGIN